MSRSAQYLYKVQPVRPGLLSDGCTPEEERAINDHFAYLQKLTQEGTVLLAGRTLNTDPGSFGIVIFTTGSDEEAQRIMESDPAVKARVFRAELYPFRVALVSTRLPAPPD